MKFFLFFYGKLKNKCRHACSTISTVAFHCKAELHICKFYLCMNSLRCSVQWLQRLWYDNWRFGWLHLAYPDLFVLICCPKRHIFKYGKNNFHQICFLNSCVRVSIFPTTLLTFSTLPIVPTILRLTAIAHQLSANGDFSPHPKCKALAFHCLGATVST
jgi:hypothetical protein